MKICLFGKYPPIQGGVSMRTYWTAHELAKRGHTVHVVTNAREASLPYRMFMRDEDWARCEAQYGDGSVTVHWTASERREWHIPTGTAFATKLASLGLDVARREGIDLIYSYYVEPYGIAAHIVAQATGLPHVTRTAGSDAGRLWSLPQFAALYDHVFKSADAVLCSPAVVSKMIEAGVDSARIADNGQRHVKLRDVFAPDGPALDVELLRAQVSAAHDADFGSMLFGDFDPALTYVGVYGKLGSAKGTRPLLRAIKRLTDRGLPIGLLVMAHERPGPRDAFRDYVRERGLEARICQLPFLPHWRVPEFIRRCAAICCLEQDFPIAFHDPVVAREVLTCGGCLVASTEVVAKLPEAHRLADGRSCIAVRDVNDVEDLMGKLVSVLDSPARTRDMRRRARHYGVDIEADNGFPRRLESILRDICETRRLSPGNIGSAQRSLHVDRRANAVELVAG